MHWKLVQARSGRARPARVLAALASVAMAVCAHGAQPHVHGVATLEVAVEGDRLTLEFASPLDNIVGFERAPRTDKEKAAARQALDRLGKPEELFVPSATARCTRGGVKIEAPVLDAAAKAQKGEHASLTAVIEFSCERPEGLSGMRVNVFDAFPRLERVDAQVASAKGQRARKLTKSDRTLSW